MDPAALMISCSSSDQIISTMNAISPQLHRDIRRQFNRLTLVYIQRYGIKGVYSRVNNRTVAELLAEFGDDGNHPPIESDEIDGLRYELFDEPPASDAERSNGSDE